MAWWKYAKPGDRVVCVDDVLGNRTPPDGFYFDPNMHGLTNGKIYTVRAIEPLPNPNFYGEGFQVLLREIYRPTPPSIEREIGYSVNRFRQAEPLFMSTRKRQRVFNKTGGYCFYCGFEFLTDQHLRDNGFLTENNRCDDGGLSASYFRMTVDHGTPRNRGGSESIENLYPCCRVCNAKKGNSTVEKFRIRAYRNSMGIPHFSNDQEVWLESQGFRIPQAEFRFWGEQNG